MGLDMYLTKKVYAGLNYEHNRKKGKKTEVIINGEKYDENKLESLVFSEAYWRKANQFHKYFVDNVQNGDDDCEEHVIEDKEVIENLLRICKDIREKCPLVDGMVKNGSHYEKGQWVDNMEIGKVMTNPEYAHDVLPRESGFFFGGTGYDQWYMQDIEYTIPILENILKDWGKAEFYYSASW